MAKVFPFYSALRTVHHNNSACTEGNNIEQMYLRYGTGGRPLCDHCSRLV